MADTISFRLSSDVKKDLKRLEKKWQTDRSEVIRRLIVKSLDEWKIKNSLDELRDGKLSLGKSAEECDVSIWEMITLAKENNIDWIGYTDKDLDNDLKIIKKYKRM